MIEKKHWLAMTLVGFIIGLLLMVQLRTQEEVAKAIPSASVNELTGTLIQAEKAVDGLAAEAQELRQQIRKYQEGEDYKRLLSDEMDKARMAAGVVAVQGPGVVITLNDSPLAVQDSQERDNDQNDYYIHDYQLRELVNTLWTAGAEAIAINEQRLVSTSEIFCGGTTIFVNGDYLTPPFTITAIGDPKDLMASLPMSEVYHELNDRKKSLGLGFEVVPVERNLQVPAYKGTAGFRYAKPAPQNGGEGK